MVVVIMMVIVFTLAMMVMLKFNKRGCERDVLLL